MSEFRQDPSSGNWVIIAPGRAGRPTNLKSDHPKRVPAPKATCPFEDLEKSGNWPPIAAYPTTEHWKIALIPNKYPALSEHDGVCSVPFHHGLYFGRTGVGFHDLTVTRDHNKQFVDLDRATALRVMEIFQDRARAGAEDPCITYVVPFYNFGPKAGGSIWHPHYQILGLPVVPSHSARMHERSESYFKENHRCLRCDTIRADKKEGKRVVAENRHAIAIAPYASRLPFEVRIMPKKHYPYFYKTPKPVVRDVTALIQRVLRSIKDQLGDPDFNLFIHEAPLDKKVHRYHHWHAELFPRITVPAGFEFSTGIYINTADPEAAALILRGKAKAARAYH